MGKKSERLDELEEATSSNYIEICILHSKMDNLLRRVAQYEAEEREEGLLQRLRNTFKSKNE
jgi:hypothetical protein